jgi:RNA polymerase sigma factor FliA
VAQVDVAQHVKLVARIARQIAAVLPPHVQIEDLISAGYVGLLDAATRYESSRNDNFEAYAQYRIRGAIMDELREKDSLSRGMRKLSTEIQAAADVASERLGRVADELEIALYLGLTVEELAARRLKLNGWQIVGFEDMTDVDGRSVLERTPDTTTEDPFEQVARHEQTTQLVACIEQLPEQMHRALSLYYMRGLTMAQVGAALGVTESRVCQIHGDATRMLRRTCAALQEHRNGIAP